jgi:ribosome maturation factor RimP
MQFTRFLSRFSKTSHLDLPLLSRPRAVLLTRLASRCQAMSSSAMPACTWAPSLLPIRSFPQKSSLINHKTSSFFKNNQIAAASTKTPASGSNNNNEEDEEDEEEFLDDDDIDIDDEDYEEDEEEYFGMEISTGGTDWGQTILTAVQKLLSTDDTLEIYSFRVIQRSKRVDIRLDKLTNKYGSPSLDEVGTFSRNLNVELEAVMGEEAAGEIEIEVSSPGAERFVKVPEEFERFGEMPMLVEYDSIGEEGGKERKKTVLQFQNVVDGEGEKEQGGLKSKWTLADVRANRSGKGRVLNKKQRETVIDIPVKDIIQVNLHVDI